MGALFSMQEKASPPPFDLPVADSSLPRSEAPNLLTGGYADSTIPAPRKVIFSDIVNPDDGGTASDADGPFNFQPGDQLAARFKYHGQDSNPWVIEVHPVPDEPTRGGRIEHGPPHFHLQHKDGGQSVKVSVPDFKPLPGEVLSRDQNKFIEKWLTRTPMHQNVYGQAIREIFEKGETSPATKENLRFLRTFRPPRPPRGSE